jgi:hypothetical protein
MRTQGQGQGRQALMPRRRACRRSRCDYCDKLHDRSALIAQPAITASGPEILHLCPKCHEEVDAAIIAHGQRAFLAHWQGRNHFDA